MLHEERTKKQRKSPQQDAEREKTHISHACLLDLQFGGVVCFNLLAGTRALVSYSADIWLIFCWLSSAYSSAIFLLFLPSQYSGRSKQEQPEPISQLKAL